MSLLIRRSLFLGLFPSVSNHCVERASLAFSILPQRVCRVSGLGPPGAEPHAGNGVCPRSKWGLSASQDVGDSHWYP